LKPLPTTALYYRWLKWARTWETEFQGQ